MKRDSIHAQCRAYFGKGAILCRKSKGHDDTDDIGRREHYDPDDDIRWLEEDAKVWVATPDGSPRAARILADDGGIEVTVTWVPGPAVTVVPRDSLTPRK